MFRKILIANRGEIAVRIIRACREMGIATVAVYSEADREALHTQLADEAVCIGPAAATDSYLNMEQILSACIATKADAIHPGFGFLSENSRFVEMCEKCNITFIGPTAEMMDKMGNKSQARLTMIEAGVPVVPGTKEPVYDAKRGAAMAEDIGYPVMIKASSGGGGKGMRIAFGPDDFEENFQVAQLESVRGFGDNTMYIEKYVQEPRHIEFQIMADKFGNVVQFGERDCSIQRNHQKMIEESPSVALTPELRRRMGDAAVRAAKAVHYESAGTIEFLLDKDKNFYFMEMNTRIQVEHPVTEMVSGVDLYQIYPKSFMDSNGDGFGDLKGVTAKLDYLADLGVDYLWLTPFFPSPQRDNGYDVADYRAVDPRYGTMEDLEELIREADRRGIGLMLDRNRTRYKAGGYVCT